jgi:hypothetical protein
MAVVARSRKDRMDCRVYGLARIDFKCQIDGRICSGWSNELSNHEKNDQGENDSLDPNKTSALLEQAM